ncbi:MULTISPECIES: LysR substrate-binding domain-containing protein [unclassified Acidovorax]|uniref:LysR substrate-binding domain-containing protein n=1 Tax=unclassified Acidovorax TaxID=2684926 RepID=UPI00070A7174|nr:MULTISPECIES: LysR substrate-binding domain-containing protein [unclassified Acidovorax]KRC15932.1 LysR family transcriptional regulator [Acidovorax sp. Root219]KRC19315.1 LysR family transcriptional regulator [Acidovorax sp. Root217]
MINISLRQLEYFVAAAQHGGAARAAHALCVSQPSISKAIADLEALWNEALFVRRHARGLDLTAAGRLRQREAQVLLEKARALEGPRREEEAGLLRVGCLSTLAPRYLPEILVRMRAKHPQVEIEMHEADTETLVQMLERGALDTALLYDLGLARAVRLEAVTSFAPYALLPAGHALATRSSLQLSTLAQEPFILINLPHSREYFLSLFRQAGVTPRIAHQTPSIEMVRSLVANGLGVSVLTTRPVRDWSYDGKRLACRRLRGPLAAQSVVLATPEQQVHGNPRSALFARMAKAAFAQQRDAMTTPAPGQR